MWPVSYLVYLFLTQAKSHVTSSKASKLKGLKAQRPPGVWQAKDRSTVVRQPGKVGTAAKGSPDSSHQQLS